MIALARKATQADAKPVEADKRGRPCKYDSHVEPYLDNVYEWIKEGYTDYSIAEQLGIHPDTFIDYKKQFPILADLYAQARLERNCLVMNSMFKKANGYIAPTYQEKLSKDGEKVSLRSEIYVPADVNAADLFLRNNDPSYKSAKMAEISINNSPMIPPGQLQSEIDKLISEREHLQLKLSAVDIQTE